MDKHAWAHNRIRKLAKLLRQQKLLKQAGYMPYALGGGLGAAAGGGLGALIGGKKHRGLGAGIGAGAGAGLGLLGAYLSQNAFGNADTGKTPTGGNSSASKPTGGNSHSSKPTGGPTSTSTSTPSNANNSVSTSAEKNMGASTATTKPTKPTSTSGSGTQDPVTESTNDLTPEEVAALENALNTDPETGLPWDASWEDEVDYALSHDPETGEPWVESDKHPEVKIPKRDRTHYPTFISQDPTKDVYGNPLPDNVSRSPVDIKYPYSIWDTSNAGYTAGNLAYQIREQQGDPYASYSTDEELARLQRVAEAAEEWRKAQDANTFNNWLNENIQDIQESSRYLRSPEFREDFRDNLQRTLDYYDLTPGDIAEGLYDTGAHAIRNIVGPFWRVTHPNSSYKGN